MRRRPIRRKCRCCKKFFVPDYRNVGRQEFCSAPACRQASKVTSQRRWCRKTENHDYFRGDKQVRRVQEWRHAHPGYWRQQKSQNSAANQSQAVGNQRVSSYQESCNAPPSDLSTLQDLCLTEHPAFVGLISMITGSTLQDDIAATGRRLIVQGQNILGLKVPGTELSTSPSARHDSQRVDSAGAAPPGAAELQLG